MVTVVVVLVVLVDGCNGTNSSSIGCSICICGGDGGIKSISRGYGVSSCSIGSGVDGLSSIVMTSGDN